MATSLKWHSDVSNVISTCPCLPTLCSMTTLCQSQCPEEEYTGDKQTLFECYRTYTDPTVRTETHPCNKIWVVCCAFPNTCNLILLTQNAGDWTWDFLHTKQMLYQWAPPQKMGQLFTLEVAASKNTLPILSPKSCRSQIRASAFSAASQSRSIEQ